MRQYAALVDLLDKELGVEPEAETRAVRSHPLPPPHPTRAASGGEARETNTQLPRRWTGRIAINSKALLSSGGFGEIYLGRDLLTGGEVAIKRLHAQSGANASPRWWNAFEREGRGAEPAQPSQHRADAGLLRARRRSTTW